MTANPDTSVRCLLPLLTAVLVAVSSPVVGCRTAPAAAQTVEWVSIVEAADEAEVVGIGAVDGHPALVLSANAALTVATGTLSAPPGAQWSGAWVEVSEQGQVLNSSRFGDGGDLVLRAADGAYVAGYLFGVESTGRWVSSSGTVEATSPSVAVVARISDGGSPLWIRPLFASGGASVTAVADLESGVVAVGVYGGVLDAPFGDIHVGPLATALSRYVAPVASTHMFVVRLEADGPPAGGLVVDTSVGAITPSAVGSASSGAVCVAGTVVSDGEGSVGADQTREPVVAGRSGVVLRIAAGGAVEWVRTVRPQVPTREGTFNLPGAELLSVAATAQGCVVGGQSMGNVVVGDAVIERDPRGRGPGGAFLLELGRDGGLEWASVWETSEHTPGFTGVARVDAIDAEGGTVLAVGRYRGAMKVGETALPGTPGPLWNGFIAIRDPDGEWSALAVDGLGQCSVGAARLSPGKGYVAGIGWGRCALGTHEISSAEERSMFLARVDVEGVREVVQPQPREQ